MASVNKCAHSAAKSSRGFSLRVALGALLSCSVIAGSAWGLASSLSAMHEAGRTLSNGTMSLVLADGPRPQPLPKAIKAGRMNDASESEIRRDELSVEDIRMAHERRVTAELALAEKRKQAEKEELLAFEAAKRNAARQEMAAAKPSLATALVEDVPVKEMEPFDLVLAEQETEEDLALPSEIPLPAARPRMPIATTVQKPTGEKPAASKPLPDRNALAYAKPERSLFGALFGRKNNESGWSGNDNKVAIYDVTNATVYMPDGTRLRAHSGIGKMRDNPRYEHVKMNGPTPAGIYRLSMREKRFYGVEAIRMTSIDGRDPKNRTGLLTHTNLLRGQTGSHGCVAFQNYEPFLKAFKRGQVRTLVVVPELPSSQTQLAALYRKAGA